MQILKVDPQSDLSAIVELLNRSHATIAEEFGFTKETNPSNSAFINQVALREQLEKGIDLYALGAGDEGGLAGCIAIEASKKEVGTYYIEKVSVLPEKRHLDYGKHLMDFALEKIKSLGGSKASIALIDTNAKLKNWYLKQGFRITAYKDFEHLPFRVCFMEYHLT